MTWHYSTCAWIRRNVLRDRAERWNHQYASGRWEGLKSPAEYARFDACVGLLRRHAAGGRLLEIGCGEALLQQRLRPEDYMRLVGVDISAVAIERAQATATDRTHYLVADMRALELDEKFEAVIFTESIYYVPRGDLLLRYYARFLATSGVFIVSSYRNQRSAASWAQIHSVATTLDRTETTNVAGTWDCEVLQLH